MGRFSVLLENSSPTEISKGGTSEPAKRRVVQPSSQSTSRPTRSSSSRVMERPKAFYITERLDKKLDEAVRRFQDVHGIKKVDRSVVVTAMLDNEDLWSDKSLDRLFDRVMSELTSRLTG
jgi:hypothetical protein